MKIFIASLLFLAVPGFPAMSDVAILPDVTVIDGIGSPPIQHASIVIRNGIILQVRRSSSLTADFPEARVFHYEGDVVIPGLVNGHGHLGITNNITSEPANYNTQNVIRQLKQYESYGVTTVMSLGLNTDLVFELRDQQRRGVLGGATILTAGRGVDVPGGVPSMNVSPEQIFRPATPEGARQAVDETAEHRPDVIKIWVDDNLGKLPRPNTEVEAAVIDQAHKRGLRVAAHVFYLEDAKTLLRDGVDILAHSIRDKPVDSELVQLMKQHRTFYIPTLQLEEAFVVYAEQPAWMQSPFFLKALQPGARALFTSGAYAAKLKSDPATEKHRQFLTTAKQNLKALFDAGVQIGFGTDSGATPTRVQGFAEHRELQLMVDSGLTPLDALRSATFLTAQMYGKESQIGSIQRGRSADLVVLGEDPLADISATERILAVFHSGVKVAGN